jgi:hypothetical protein
MMGGMLLAILLYRPIYKQMFETTNVKNKTEKWQTKRRVQTGTTKSVMVACKNAKTAADDANQLGWQVGCKWR